MDLGYCGIPAKSVRLMNNNKITLSTFQNLYKYDIIIINNTEYIIKNISGCELTIIKYRWYHKLFHWMLIR